MSQLEIVAALFGLFAVGLIIVRNVWCWPVGLVQVLLYTKVFYDAQLYSQTLLQIVFAILQLHGWWQWRVSLQQSANESAIEQVRVERLEGWLFPKSVGVGLVLSALLGAWMLKFTDAKWAMADAVIAGFSLVAQWLLNHRKLENWYLWIVVNVLTIVVCSAQAMWPTVVLYVAFLIMAIHGLRAWRRQLKTQVV